MARDLLTIRCPEDIKQAIEERITTGKAKTDVVLKLLRTALGMPSTATNEVSTTSLDERITVLLDNRTTELYEQVNARVEEAIAPVREALSAMATQLGERQETYKQWLNEAREIGRELERVKQQSPIPDESTIESARESVVEDALADSSDDVSETTATSNTDTSPPQQRKGITATALAKRFRLKAVSSVTRRPEGESEEEFKEWSRQHDPNDIPWVKRQGKGRSSVLYYPYFD